MKEYNNLLQDKGIPLSSLGLGSNIALEAMDAIDAISIIKKPILGGDVLSVDETGNIKYAYDIIGQKYHVLNWSCDRKQDESRDEFRERSHKLAREKIHMSSTLLKNFGMVCYVYFVM
jgi:hypothetical protein